MRGVVVTLALAVAGIASGCTTSDDTAPLPTGQATTPTTGITSTESTTSVASRPTDAPPVTRTLDVAPYRTRPCDLLTAEQQTALDLPRTATVGASCTWEKAQPKKKKLSVEVLVGLNYFNQVYRDSNDEDPPGSGDKEWDIFEPITIAGQPAVVLNPAADRTYAAVLVATSPDDSINIAVTTETTTADPRVAAVTTAEQIVDNLVK